MKISSVEPDEGEASPAEADEKEELDFIPTAEGARTVRAIGLGLLISVALWALLAAAVYLL
jgi:hypothetical protein